MRDEPFTLREAEIAKTKNITEIGLDFSTMTRVFARESGAKILARLEAFFVEICTVKTQAEYDSLHADFCDWFTKNIRTAEKKFRGGRSLDSRQSSYGHAAKVLDVAAKVYIYYCSQPSPEDARRLIPMLHAALDTDMMRKLCGRSPERLHGVDRAEYERLQILVAAKCASGIHAVQYDDVMWRRLQRS